MASPSSFLQLPLPLPLLLLITSLFLSLASCSIGFSFSSFSPNDPLIVSNGTTISGGSLRLTDGRTSQSGEAAASGRAYYAQPIKLWRFGTNSTANFTTYFEFVISFANGSAAANSSSGGFIFFLAPTDAFSSASGLSLSNGTAAGRQNVTRHLLAIEFDSFRDNQTSNITTGAAGDTLAALITYRGNSNSLSVKVRKPQAASNSSSLSLSHVVDLKQVLPEEVLVGFSVTNGTNAAVQRITKWNFTSTMDDFDGGSGAFKPWLLGPIAALAILAAVAAVSACYFCGGEELKMRILRAVFYPLVCCNIASTTSLRLGEPMDEEFDQGTGPRRFSYKRLASATGNFSEKRKLGEGGFGGVYRGVLNKQDVAVKKISSRSKQGRKEYASEVKIISRLRHRNLVQLIGWCHERNEFLLVYEFLPNGSLDQHLFDRSSSLPWQTRYNIALGLASALMYLHEEWEQCVVHRDVKSSNVMLDSDFNAKLGDFGLARLVDHKLGQQTTLPAGTLGYLAPECFTTAKASKESDVFSFGIVALEIATGRRAIEHNSGEYEVRLAQKVWELHGEDRLLDAVDPSLSMDADEMKQMECLLLVGLWCAHPDQGRRPAIRQVIKALTFEGSLPDVPRAMPVPVFADPPLQAQPEQGPHSTPPSVTFTSYLTGR